MFLFIESNYHSNPITFGVNYVTKLTNPNLPLFNNKVLFVKELSNLKTFCELL